MKTALLRNILILVLIAGLLTFLYFTSDRFRLHAQFIVRVLSQGDLENMKEYLLAWGVWAPIISSFIMVFQAIAAPLPAFLVTISNGWLFGVFWGTALSWSSSMLGATLCFYIARGFGRPAAERFASKKALNFVDRFFERYGSHSVLIARLIPVISFDVVSYAAGLTPISLRSFLIATGVGQMPATIFYSWLGEQINTAANIWLNVFLGLAGLTVLGFTIRQALRKRMNDKEETTEAA